MRPLLLASLLLLLATPSRAGILTSATLDVEIGAFPSIAFTASGAVGGAPSDTQVFLGGGSAFAGMVTPTLPLGVPPPFTGLNFTMGFNHGGSFTGTTPGNLGGKARFPVGFCAESYGGLCIIDLSVPFGVTTTSTPPPQFGVQVTLYANAWTAGTAVVALTTPTSQGATLATRQGSNGLDALGRGTLVLVSGVNVVTNIAGQIPAFATLTLSFVPEPGVGLLLLAAAALLWRSGRPRGRGEREGRDTC